MSDRELLEKAARAVGYGVESHNENRTVWAYLLSDIPDEDGEVPIFIWRPLTEDGDCARLEAAAGINVQWSAGCVYACNFDNGDVVEFEEYADHGGDKNAARRRASVRAAAALPIPSQGTTPATP